MGEVTDFIITILVLLGIFLMGYMAYRQQSLLDTFREVKEMFEEKIETASEVTTQVYK